MAEFFFYVFVFLLVAICMTPFLETGVGSMLMGIFVMIFLIDFFYFEFLISCVLDPLRVLSGTQLKP